MHHSIANFGIQVNSLEIENMLDDFDISPNDKDKILNQYDDFSLSNEEELVEYPKEYNNDFDIKWVEFNI